MLPYFDLPKEPHACFGSFYFIYLFFFCELLFLKYYFYGFGPDWDACFPFADPTGFILFPLVVHSFDLVVSSIGIISIRGTRESGVKIGIEDPMAILQKGYSVTIFFAVLAFGLVSNLLCL